MTESYTSTIESKSKSKHQLINTNNIISFFIFLSLLNTPKNIQATTQESQNNIKSIFELNNTTNLLNQMNQKFWIILPKQYNENLQNFVSNSTTLHNEAAAKFTENFISEQMSKDRWISKENQYLFIRCAIYFVLTNWGELYNWTDWDEQRYNEYETAFDYFLECVENYKTKLKELMKNEQQKAEDDAQKAKDDAQKAKDNAQKAKDDAQKAKDDAQIAKNDAQIAKNDVMTWDTLLLNEMVRFYNLHINNSDILTAWEIQKIKRIVKETIESCKRHWIDYRAYFLKILWNNKKVEELFKICEIE